eukprot:11559667-Prorocentrum_lima.AAC.1
MSADVPAFMPAACCAAAASLALSLSSERVGTQWCLHVIAMNDVSSAQASTKVSSDARVCAEAPSAAK